MAKKELRQSIKFQNQSPEDGEVEEFSWNKGKEILADVFIKYEVRRKVLDDLIEDIFSKHTLNKNNLINYVNDKITIKNETTKETSVRKR